MSVIDTMKEHPYITGGVALVGVVAFLYLGGGSGGDNGGGYSGDSVTAGNALNDWQAGIASQQALAGIDLQKAITSLGATVEVEKLRTQSAYDISQLQAGVAYAQIDAGKAVSVAGILAQEKATQEETKRLQISANQSVEMQRLLTDTINNQTNAQRAVALEAQKPHGLFSFIFG